ncbi:MAG: hypothetical protein J6Q65_08215, partial [Lentisphaeria bacterium]|nr:hypothetical protein [Lentisphaeria bacterium]
MLLKCIVRTAAVTVMLFSCFAIHAQQGQILLKQGKPIPVTDILSKDQFGIMTVAYKNPENGDLMRKFIPFVDMNPASLSYFPFCDPKVVERIHQAVLDREVLIRQKFKDRYAEYEGTQDFTKNLLLHSGVHEYSILFSGIESTKTGMIGYIYSDSPDCLFYGKIFLYGLIGNPGTVWIGNIYPTERTQVINGSTYPVLTVIAPEKKKFEDPEAEEKEKEKMRRERRKGPRGGMNRQG